MEFCRVVRVGLLLGIAIQIGDRQSHIRPNEGVPVAAP